MRTLAVAVLFSAMMAGVSWANEDVSIENPVVREAPPGMMVTAAYATLINTTATEIAIDGASSDSFHRVEIHLSQVVDGVAQMLPQHELVVPANGKVELKPGSFHLMLMGAKSQLKAGDEIDITINTSSGDVTQTFTVKKF